MLNYAIFLRNQLQGMQTLVHLSTPSGAEKLNTARF